MMRRIWVLTRYLQPARFAVAEWPALLIGTLLFWFFFFPAPAGNA
jgi:hypothetical protein